MKSNNLGLFLGLLFLLCSSTLVRAQSSISINGPTVVCEGTTHMYDYAPSPNVFYSWVINSKGYISSVSGNQTHVHWGASGTGVLTLMGLDSLGDTTELGTLNVTILPEPEPVITSNAQVACQPLGPPTEPDTIPVFIDTGCVKVCENSLVTYTANGNPGSLYTWTVVGGSASPAGNTCDVTWGSAGPGTVTVRERTPNGCVGTTTICVDIIEAPIADFYALPDSSAPVIHICDSTEVIFIDRSTASAGSPIVSWHWDFGDGTYSNQQGSRQMPISHVYRAPGPYTATLTVTNACGCKSSYSIEVNVDPQKALQIECPGVVCEGDTANYTVNTSCLGFWSVDGGTIISQTFNTLQVVWDNVDQYGFGYVYYDPAGCPTTCPTVYVAKVPVVLMNGTIQGPDTICPGKQYLYRLPQWPTTRFDWSEPTGLANHPDRDQPNEFIVEVDPSNGGNTMTIECNYYNTLHGCSGYATKDVYIQELPTLSGPDIVCLNANGVFTLTDVDTLSADWTLTYPDMSTATGSGGTFVGLFDQVGDYILTVTGDFCDPPVKLITVNNPPIPPHGILGPDTICKGAPTKYEGFDVVPGTVFNWDMTNGSVNATAGNHTFVTLDPNSNGPFILKLWREDKNPPHCASDTITMAIDTPVVEFDVLGKDTVCPSSYESYSVNYGEGETYEWRIETEGMGSISSGQGTRNVSVLWNEQTGTARLICRVRKCFDIYYEDTLLVYIKPSYAVDIMGPTIVCAGESFMLNVSGNGSSVDWNMGDGTQTNTGSSITHTYQVGNTSTIYRTVVATVTDPYGCPGTAQDTTLITVNPTPGGVITSNGPGIYHCDSMVSETLSVLPFGAAPPISSYQWYRNGVPAGSGSSLYVTQPGAYTVKLTGSNGCEYTTELYLVDTLCPDTCNLSFSPSISLNVTIDSCGRAHATVTKSSYGFVGYTWVTPEGTITQSDANNAYVVYDESGRYYIDYLAAYGDSTDTCLFTVRKYFVVPYIAELSVDPLCTGTDTTRDVVLSFTGSQAGPITSYIYSVDGNSTGCPNSSTCTTTVSTGVTHTFELIISDGVNPPCTATVVKYIPGLPHASFDYQRDSTCEKQAAVDFTNNSTPVGQFTSYWDFDDGANNRQQDPERVYENAGTYWVNLTITDEFGCTDDTTREVVIVEMRQDGFISATPSSPCQGNPVSLRYNSNTAYYPEWYEWMNDLNNFASGVYNPINVYESGYYWVKGYDRFGCYVETEADSVHVIEVPPAFVAGDSIQCKDATFVLSGYAGSDSDIEYQWMLGGTDIPGETNATLKQTLTTPGTYTYRVIVTVPNPAGGYCSDTSEPFNVLVHALPAEPGILFSIIDCNDYTVELQADPTQPYGTYNWSSGDQGSPVYVNAGGNYQLTYTDTFGCVSKNTVYVPKDPRVYLWIFPTGCYTICPPEFLEVTGPIIEFAFWEYQRNMMPYMSGTGYVSDVHIMQEGTYTLTLDNGWCSATSGDMHVDTSCSKGNTGDIPPAANPTNGIRDLKQGKVDMNLIPNPAQDQVEIHFAFNEYAEQTQIKVLDATGRVVATHQPNTTTGKWNLSLDQLSSGIYNVVLIENGNAVMYGKLSIAK